MNLNIFWSCRRKFVFASCLLFSLQSLVLPQPVSEPEETRLLNGLRILLWTRPAEQEVLLKLRIHSGAAFDLAGKAGSMALLGDILFPDPATREYFTEEMQGRLSVTTDYDSITVTMQGRAREFEQIVEILRAALVTTPLTVENVARVREGRIKVLKETSISPAMLADRAIAARLFGEFPYGRPYIGTVESLERIDRADLMLARERFLNPNNATLAVIGNVQPNRAKRVLRQLLGVWRKSDQLVPATFRQPAMPDSRTLIINAPGNQSVEVRLAVRGLARNDPDAVAATLLSGVTRSRWEKLFPDLALKPVFARHDAFALPGMFVMGATVDNLLAGKTLAAAQKVIKGFAGSAVTIEELEQAKSELMISANKQLASLDGFTEAWLDIDTYGLPSVAEQTRTIKAISTTDLQRVAQRLFREGAFASVVIGNAELVKTQIEPHGKVELMGELDSGSEAKPSISPQAKPALKPE